MKKLFENKRLTISVVVVILILGGLIIAWQSALYTLNHMSFKNVTTAQLASAMRQDEFWSSNRFNSLVFDGKVKSINKSSNQTTLQFETSDAYGVTCEVNNTNTKFEVGGTYKFGVETYQAERQPQGVLLHNCIYFSS